MCTLLLLGGIGAATALSCGDPAAQNFLYRADGLFDSALCAYEPVYYCNDPTATNYQSGKRLSVVRAPPQAPCPTPPRRAPGSCEGLLTSAVASRGSALEAARMEPCSWLPLVALVDRRSRQCSSMLLSRALKADERPLPLNVMQPPRSPTATTSRGCGHARTTLLHAWTRQPTTTTHVPTRTTDQSARMVAAPTLTLPTTIRRCVLPFLFQTFIPPVLADLRNLSFVTQATYHDGTCTYDKVGCTVRKAHQSHERFHARLAYQPPAPVFFPRTQRRPITTRLSPSRARRSPRPQPYQVRATLLLPHRPRRRAHHLHPHRFRRCPRRRPLHRLHRLAPHLPRRRPR